MLSGAELRRERPSHPSPGHSKQRLGRSEGCGDKIVCGECRIICVGFAAFPYRNPRRKRAALARCKTTLGERVPPSTAPGPALTRFPPGLLARSEGSLLSKSPIDGAAPCRTRGAFCAVGAEQPATSAPAVPGGRRLDHRGAELLFQVLTEREEKNSVAIASNESSAAGRRRSVIRGSARPSSTGSPSPTPTSRKARPPPP